MERAFASDPRLEALASLTDVQWRQRFEAEHGLFVAEGAKTIDRALSAGLKPTVIVGHDRWADDLQRWATTAGPHTPVLLADHDVLEKVTGYHVHRGALAVFARPAPLSVAQVAEHARRLVIMEDVVDHVNVGAMFRTAAALDVDGVVLSPRSADPLYRRAVKVSMGAAVSLPWARAQSWPGALPDLQAAGMTVVALVLDPSAMDVRELATQAPQRLAFMVGTEGQGLSAAAVAHADVKATIPMARGTDSLNVAQALGISLWACATGA